MTTQDSSRDPAFLPGEIRRVLSGYPIGEILEARAIHAGDPAAPKAFIRTAAGRFVLKRRRSGPHDDLGLRAQVELRRRRFPAPGVVRRADGALRAELDGRTYELFEHIQGRPYSHRVHQAAAGGRALAVMRDELDLLDLAPRAPLMPRRRVDVATVARSFRKLHAADQLALDRLAHDWFRAGEQVRRIAPASLEPGSTMLIHGDYHPGNILYQGDAVVGVVDFDDCRIGWPAAEAASAAIRFALIRTGPSPLGWTVAPDSDLLTRFWSGLGPADPATAEVEAWLMIESVAEEVVGSLASADPQDPIWGGGMVQYAASLTAWLAEHAVGIGGLRIGY